MSLSSRAAKGGAIVLGFQGLKFLFNMLSIVVLARLIDPEYYGLLAMVAAIMGVASIFRDFGLSTAALQAKDLSHAQQSNLFWINFGVGAGLTVVGWFAAWPIAAFYGQPELVPVVHWLAFTFIISGASTQFRVVINRGLRFLTLAICDLTPYIVGFAAAVATALAGYQLEALVTQQLVVALASLIGVVAAAKWFPSWPRRVDMSNLVRFGLSLAATQLVSYATRNVDSIAIGRVWGPVALGNYDRAYQLMITPLNQINTPLSSVAIPVLSRIQDEEERYLAYLRRAQLVALYVTTLALGLLAALAPQIIPLLLGNNWEAAIPLVAVLAVGGIFRSLVQICYWIYMSRGLATAQLRYFLITQPLLTGFMLLGLPWGAMGVAIGHSVGFAIYWAVSLMWVGRVAEVNVRPMFADATRVLLVFSGPAAVLAAAAATYLPLHGDALRLVVGLAVAAAWCALASWLNKRIRADLGNLVDFGKLAIRRRRGADA